MDHNVVQFDVSVDYSMLVHLFERKHHLLEDSLSHVDLEPFVLKPRHEV